MFPHYIIVFCATFFACMNMAALYDNSVPYFPIEISRMGASGRVALATFQSFAIGLFGLLVVVKEQDWNLWLLALSFAAIAFFDDANHFKVHMTAVLALVTCLGVRAASNPASFHQNMWVMATGIGIYLSRVLIRLFALWWFESAVPPKIFYMGQDIMYRGSAACTHPATLHFFRVSGLLQWVVFAVFSQIQ